MFTKLTSTRITELVKNLILVNYCKFNVTNLRNRRRVSVNDPGFDTHLFTAKCIQTYQYDTVKEVVTNVESVMQ